MDSNTQAAAPTMTSPHNFTTDERARMREAVKHIRCARATVDDESVSMDWDSRDDVTQDLTRAIELLKSLMT